MLWYTVYNIFDILIYWYDILSLFNTFNLKRKKVQDKKFTCVKLYPKSQIPIHPKHILGCIGMCWDAYISLILNSKYRWIKLFN